MPFSPFARLIWARVEGVGLVRLGLVLAVASFSEMSWRSLALRCSGLPSRGDRLTGYAELPARPCGRKLGELHAQSFALGGPGEPAGSASLFS